MGVCYKQKENQEKKKDFLLFFEFYGKSIKNLEK